MTPANWLSSTAVEQRWKSVLNLLGTIPRIVLWTAEHIPWRFLRTPDWCFEKSLNILMSMCIELMPWPHRLDKIPPESNNLKEKSQDVPESNNDAIRKMWPTNYLTETPHIFHWIDEPTQARLNIQLIRWATDSRKASPSPEGAIPFYQVSL